MSRPYIEPEMLARVNGGHAITGPRMRPATESERQLIELRAQAPLQSKGKAVEDAGFLPLFIAANEPKLI